MKRLDISKEHRKTEEGEKGKFLTLLTKAKESGRQWIDKSWRTGLRIEASHLANWCWDEPVIDKIGRKGTSLL